MKKIAYYMLLLLMLSGWACKDEIPAFTRPDTLFNVDVFVDPRDGKTYHTVTIGDQTWMVENFAFRLDSGSWVGCYTYDELKTTELDTAAIYAAIPKPRPDVSGISFDDFWAEVEAAKSDGRLSNDISGPWGFWTPSLIVDMVKSYIDNGLLQSTVDDYMNNPANGMYVFLAYLDDEIKTNAVIPVLEDIIDGLLGIADPYDLFKTLVAEAEADGRISNNLLPDDDFGMITPAMIVDMTLPSVTSVDEFMAALGYWISSYPSLNELLVPVLNAIIAEVDAETGEEEWPPAELKAEALAAAVKEAQSASFDLAESFNGHYSQKYGLLYTLDAARKAVPEGWRIPTDEDWKKLERALGMITSDLDRMEEWRGSAAISDWLKSEESGFGLVYGGTRAYNSLNGSSQGKIFMNRELNAYFLTDTQMRLTDSTYVNVIRTISVLRDGIRRGTSHVTAAHSLRLIKDAGSAKKEKVILDGTGIVPGEAIKELE